MYKQRTLQDTKMFEGYLGLQKFEKINQNEMKNWPNLIHFRSCQKINL